MVIYEHKLNRNHISNIDLKDKAIISNFLSIVNKFLIVGNYSKLLGFLGMDSSLRWNDRLGAVSFRLSLE